jgi:hypothetical protein
MPSGLPGVVIVEQKLGFLGQEWLAVLLVAILRPAHGADHLFGWDPVHPLGVHAHEVLAATSHDVGLDLNSHSLRFFRAVPKLPSW